MTTRPAAPPRKADLAIPARTTPAIPIVHRTPLAPATVAWQLRPPSDSLTILVKGTFDLVPDGPARARKESDPPTGDVYLDDDIDRSVRVASDFAFFKPKADVTVVGHAHAPGGSSPASRVSLRFGAGAKRIDRSIHVFGDRVWRHGLTVALAPTDPAPFDAMPLVYERAFGGASYDGNPVGTGRDNAARLPNLEDPDRPIVSPGDTPQPMCFAPVPPTFKARTEKLGTYDSRWLQTRWPYFPEDFDWAYYQAAPRAQQTDWLTGDEPFEIAGMRRDHPIVRGRLPGKRVQCFAQRTAAAGGKLEEILLRLDTAAFDLDEMKVNLVWRGLYEVSDEEAPEIAAILVLMSDLRDPAASLDDAREALRVAWTPREPVELEEPEPPPANDVAAEEEPDPEIARMEAELAEREKKILDELRAAGVAVDEPATPPPPMDPHDLAARLRASGMPEEDVEGFLEAVTAPAEQEPSADPPEPAIRDRVIAMLRDGESFDGMDLTGADLSDLDFGGRSLRGVILASAKLHRCVFEGATLEGAQLGGAQLDGANLTDANLSGADLTGASITEARFEAAEIGHADFGGASGERCDFRRARGDRPSFAGARLQGATFAAASLLGADFTRAVLDQAIFEDAALPEVRLYEARCERGRFDRAKMREARANGAVIVNASLRSIDANSSEWEGATLDGSTFLGSSLPGAGLSRTSCHGTVFSGADIREGRFRRAALPGATLLKANLMKATFERADLTKADLRMANLHGAEVWKAKLDGANLDLALVTQSKLQGRRR